MCRSNQAPVGSTNTDFSISDEIPEVTLSTTSLTYSDNDWARFRLGDAAPWVGWDEIDSEIRWTSSRSLETSPSSLLKSEELADLSVMTIIELNWYYIELDSL